MPKKCVSIDMNVAGIVLLSVALSTASIGTLYFFFVRERKKKKINGNIKTDFELSTTERVLDNDDDDEMGFDPEQERIQAPSPPVIIANKQTFIINLISHNLNKIYKKGAIDPTKITHSRNYNWNNFTITEDNWKFIVNLSVGLKTDQPCVVSIEDGKLVISDIPQGETPRILMYLSGNYFSAYIDEFVFVDDVVEFDTKTKVFIFDGKPFIRVDVKSVTCSMETEHIKLRLL